MSAQRTADSGRSFVPDGTGPLARAIPPVKGVSYCRRSLRDEGEVSLGRRRSTRWGGRLEMGERGVGEQWLELVKLLGR